MLFYFLAFYKMYFILPQVINDIFMSVNKVILIGNVGKDPEIRSLKSGNEVALFNLATSDYWRDKTTGEKKTKTEWHRVVVYPMGIVNIIKNSVKKGSKLYISGSIHTREWDDQQGVRKHATEIILQGYNAELQILYPRPRNNNTSNDAENYDSNYYSSVDSSNETPNIAEDGSVEKIIDDDIPF